MNSKLLLMGVILVAMAVCGRIAFAQDTPTLDTTVTSTPIVTAAMQARVLAAIDSVPATVEQLVTRTQLPERTVRIAVMRLWDQRSVRYKLVPSANGDTTATGRPRRERAYYVSPPPASDRPSRQPR